LTWFALIEPSREVLCSTGALVRQVGGHTRLPIMLGHRMQLFAKGSQTSREALLLLARLGGQLSSSLR